MFGYDNSREKLKDYVMGKIVAPKNDILKT